jgi:hypothetical protein
MVATAFTLVFVPVMYSLLRRQAPRPDADDDLSGDGDTLPSPTTNQLEHESGLTFLAGTRRPDSVHNVPASSSTTIFKGPFHDQFTK